MSDRDPLGKRFREFREKIGLTQREMAELLAVSHGTVGHWETGRQTPSVSDVNRLAQALEWEPQDVYFELGLIGADQPRSAYEVLAELQREGKPLPRQIVRESAIHASTRHATHASTPSAPQNGDSGSDVSTPMGRKQSFRHLPMLSGGSPRFAPSLG